MSCETAIRNIPVNFYSIAAKYNGPLEAAHAYIDDDRYDMDS